MNITPLLRTGSLIASRQVLRQYAFKSDLKIKWVRPEKIQSIDPIKSGDCSKLPPVSDKLLVRGFDKSKELETYVILIYHLIITLINMNIKQL